MKDSTVLALRPVTFDLLKLVAVKAIRPALGVVGVYGCILGLVIVSRGYSVLDFVHLGDVWSLHDHTGSWGYDGQFYYQLARNPLQAYHFMDNAPYRYQRILYPLLVTLLSFGNSALIPYMLLCVNLASIVLSVEIVAYLLIKRGLSPWYSLALGLYFGQAAALTFDTSEPFTCLLLCLALLCLSKERIRLAALWLGLACLAREVVILFPLGYIVSYLLQRRYRDALWLGSLGCLPILVWLAVIYLIFGRTGLTFAPPFEHVPFGGIFYFAHAPRKYWLLLLLMFVPTLGSTLLCGWELWKRRLSLVWFAWLLNLYPVIFLSHYSYLELISCGRITLCLVLATLAHGIFSGSKVVLWTTQIYAVTLILFIFGIIYHMSAFIL